MDKGVATGVQALTSEAAEVAHGVIDLAMSLRRDGVLTDSEVMDLGCMAADCLTLSTVAQVARLAGVDPGSLLV